MSEINRYLSEKTQEYLKANYFSLYIDKDKPPLSTEEFLSKNLSETIEHLKCEILTHVITALETFNLDEDVANYNISAITSNRFITALTAFNELKNYKEMY